MSIRKLSLVGAVGLFAALAFTLGGCKQIEKYLNEPPTVSLSANPTSGPAPLTVTFTVNANDPDGDAISCTLDFGDQTTPATQCNGAVNHTYQQAGTYAAVFTAQDSKGKSSTTTTTVTVSTSGTGGGGGGNPPGITTLWYDDFESDPVGSLPSGWHIVYSGAGTNQQYVTDTLAASGNHSFRVLGTTGWSAVIARNFSTSANVIGFEYEIYYKGQASNYVDLPGFICETCGQWSQYWGVGFDHKTGEITLGTRAGVKVLGYWQPGTWIRVRFVLDRSQNTVSVWINGVQKAFAEPIPNAASNTGDIQGFAVGSGWAAQEVFYDNVKVFVVK